MILAEHPGLEAALEGALADGGLVALADGERIDPLAHLTQHQLALIAVWTDSPAEVWQTAKRLLGLGHERHEVLHMLGFALMDRFLVDLVATLEEEGLPNDGPPHAAVPTDLPDVASALAALPASWEASRANAEAENDRRRNFAIPPPGSPVYGGEVLDLFDREDEDARELFIRAEHPELWDALDANRETSGPGGEPMNPRLHLAMHAVIANQLMADDPPQAWDTAQRLLDLGYERHEVLHMLASAISEHMLGALRDGSALDPDEYLALLDDLPDSWEALADPQPPRRRPARSPGPPPIANQSPRRRKGASGRPRGRKRRN